MALVLADRVRETTTVTGTGTATLLGAAPGYQSFSAVGNANTTYYVIANQSASEWEVGIGTYTSSGTTLSRDTVLASSNGGSLVNFSAGTKDVFVDYPAGKAVYEDAAGNVDGYPITGGTINNTTIGATTPSTGVFTTLTAQNETLVGTGQNFCLYSEQFDNAYYGKFSASVTANSTTSPIGTTTADTLVENSSTNDHGLFRNDIIASGFTSYVLSVYAKAAGRNFLIISLKNAGVDNRTWFNVSTGVIGTSSAGNTASITSVGNGWYRCSITRTFLATQSAGLTYALSNADNVTSYTGDGTSGIYLWGSQLEVGSVLNTYIPTTTTAVYGTPTLSFSGVASIGLQSDGSLYETSAGTGNVRFYTNNIAQEQARVSHTASAVNYHQLTGSATGSGPIHSVAGSDTNIDLNLTTKGTGAVNLNTGNGIAFKVGDAGATSVDFIQASSSSFSRPSLVARPVSGSGTINLALSSFGSGSIQFATNNLSQEQLRVAHTASAVNYVQVTGAATGNSPNLGAQGSDSNINMAYSSKGTFGHAFYSNNFGQLQFTVAHAASAVNWFQATGGATGFGPVLSAQGSDTNIPAVLQPKGTGALQAQQTDSTATGGNARGANAVDWQTARASASQVASQPFSVISGGTTNQSTGYGAVVVGGTNNTSSNNWSFVGAGVLNTASGQQSAVVNGISNTAAGFYNFIGSGFTNSGTSASAVTTQSGTMNATTAVTLSGSNASIKVGQYITGTSIASDTYVAAISGTSLTLSKVASGSSTSTLSFYTPHGVVVGGGNNQATGSYSFIGGGGDAGTAGNRNVASGDWSFVGGGSRNTASGVGSFIGGGGFDGGTFASNTASGSASVIGGGLANSNTGYASVVAGGSSNQASTTGTVISGGVGNIANSNYSAIMGGNSGTTRGVQGYHVFPACIQPISTNTGVSQSALLVLGVQTTDATATVLRSNTSAAGNTNQVILPNNSAYAFKGSVIANVTGGGNTKAWAIEGAIKRGANAASTALVGTPTVTSGYADAGASTWAITATADTTNGGLAITFTGQASTTIRCVAKLETTEVTF